MGIFRVCNDTFALPASSGPNKSASNKPTLGFCFLLAWSAYSSILKMGTVLLFSKTMDNLYETTWHEIPDRRTVQQLANSLNGDS